jgi:D-alanine-D-alanine ligase-like ATP-grasp enzyme
MFSCGVCQFSISSRSRSICCSSIDSQSEPSTETDFRVMNITGLLPHSIVELPENLENQIRLLMRHLGLTYGCLDFIQTKDDEFYFLEVNPAGQWLWIEQLTGLPISSAIADELRA